MAEHTSSAEPLTLWDYSAVTTQIDSDLISESHSLGDKLEHFEASCKEECVHVVHLADKLRDYAERAKETDSWVDDVGTDFRAADEGTIRSDSSEGDSFWDGVQGVLDVAGFIPVIGEAADLVSGIISAARGDWVGAGLSVAALIPTGGQLAGAAKIARRGRKALKKAPDLGSLPAVPAYKVDNALRTFKRTDFSAGGEKFVITKERMKHVLERHHPEYWAGEVKERNTPFDSKLSPEDVTELMKETVRRGYDDRVEITKGRTFEYVAEIDGVAYKARTEYGGVVQFHPD